MDTYLNTGQFINLEASSFDDKIYYKCYNIFCKYKAYK